jgi:hypothetical protein
VAGEARLDFEARVLWLDDASLVRCADPGRSGVLVLAMAWPSWGLGPGVLLVFDSARLGSASESALRFEPVEDTWASLKKPRRGAQAGRWGGKDMVVSDAAQ